MGNRIAVCLILGLALSGCNAAVQGYVKGVVTPPSDSPKSPVTSSGPAAIKISGGHLNSAGNSSAVNMTMTPTNQRFQAGNMSVRLSISRNRVSTQ